MSKKIIIVGGGPGGYAAALKAAQLGAQVSLCEYAQLGGTCLNVGCVPTKALLHVGEFYRNAKLNSVPGVEISGTRLNWSAAQEHKNAVVKQFSGGVGALLRHSGVTVYNEKGVLTSGKSVKVGNKTLEADAVILAIGSQNAALNFPGADLPGVIDSTGALSLPNVPKSIVIAGAGVVGIEFASLYSSLGSKVTIIEFTNVILPSVDEEIAKFARAALESGGVRFFTGAKLIGTKETGRGLSVSFESGGKKQEMSAEKLLIAAGRRANTQGVGLEAIGVKIARGAVDTDEFFKTNIPGLYAAGDCNGRSMLAHAAMAQGESAAEHIMGVTSHINHKIIPACIYSSPEISCVGLTEAQVKNAGIDYAVGRFDFAGNAKAAIDGTGGMVKIIADKKIGEILGVHMIGSRVTEIIAQAALCMSMEGTVEDIVNTIHAHPTVSETVREAAMAVFGKSLHSL